MSHVFRNGIVIIVAWHLILRGIITIMWNIVVVSKGISVAIVEMYIRIRKVYNGILWNSMEMMYVV